MATIQQLEDAIARARAAQDEESARYLLDQRNQKLEEKYGSTTKTNRGNDSSFFENVGKGFASGAVGMAETASLGAAAFYEEEEELKARDKIKSVADSFRPEGGDKDSLTYGISSALGSIAGIAAPAAIAAMSAPAAAATAVGTGVAGLLGVGAARGEASERARAAGATEEQRNTAINSILVNAAGVAEALPMGRVFKSINVPVLNKFIDKLSPKAAEGISGKLKNAAITGGLEGVQEVSAEIAQNLTEQEYNALAETFGGTRESFTMGAAAGAILDLFLGKRARGSKPTDTAPEEAVVAEEESRDARNEEQIDMFSTELDDAEIADLDREEEVGPTEEEIVRENERRTTEKTETGATEQLDMLDQIEYEDIQVEEDAKIVRAQADADAETRLRQESDLESADARVEGRAVSESNARRESILQEVIEASPTTNYNTVRNKFSAALSTEGITDNKANEREILTIQKAINFQKAEEGSRLTKGVDQNTDTSAMEAQIPERRSAVETGDVDPAAREQVATKKVNPEEKRVFTQEEQIDQTGPTNAEKTTIASNLTATIKENKAAPSTATMAGRLEKSIAKDKRRSAVLTEDVSDTSSQEAAPADIEGSIEFPTAVPRGTEFTNPDDVTAINTLLGKKIPRDEKGMEQTAQTYLKRFKRPADAFTAIAFEIAENTPKFRAQKGTPTSEKAKFAGTGGVNTKATLQWIEKNLSPDAKAEIDKRVVEQQKESTKVEEDVTARSTSAAEATRLKRRDNEAAVKVDKVTDGKAKVVGTSKPRKKVFKVEDAVPEATDIDANPKTGTKPTKMTDVEKKLAATSEAIENVQGKKGKNTKAPLSDDMSPEQVSAKIKADTEIALAAGLKITHGLRLDPRDAVALNNDLPSAVTDLIKKGRPKRALQELANTTKNKRVKQVARALAANMGDTTIVIGKVEGLDVASFNANANTITLDPDKSMTVHALLHESTHAATINILSNKSHPLTKQLTKLYEDTKGSLDTVYGAESLAEFVAETFSNPAFQRKLASINIKGEDINVLQRFFRAVTNYVRGLIGMDTVPTGSALDAADSAIMAILAPSMKSVGIGSLDATKDGVTEVLNSMAGIQKSLRSGPLKPFIDSAVEFLGDAGVSGGARQFFLKLTGSQALGDIARRYGFGKVGLELHATFENMRANMQKADKKIKERLDSYDVWAKDAKSEQVDLLNDIVYSEEYGATVYQVDPTKQRSYYEKTENRFDDSGNDKLPIYKELEKQWNKLEPKGKKMFTEQREEYMRLHKELVKVIEGEIDSLEAKIDPNDPQSQKTFDDNKAKLKKQINQRLLDAGQLEVYFPLVRQGKYKLSFDTLVKNKKTGESRVESVFLMFDRKVDRDNILEEVQADPNTQGEPVPYDGDTKRASFNNAPSGSFVSDVLAVVNASMPKGKDSIATQEQIMRLFIESLPETSFAKSLQKRKGTLGFDKNVRAAMDSKGHDLSSQIEKMKSSAVIRALEKEVNDTKRPANIDLGTFNKVRDELLNRAQFARTGATNKTTEKLAQRSNQLAFIYTIGFNASSALVNLSQIPLVVMPFLGAKFGYAETSMAMARASKFVGSSAISIDEYYDINLDTDVYTLKPSMIKKIQKTSKDKDAADIKIAEMERMIPLVKAANDRGQVYHSEIKDQLRATEGTSKNPALKMLDKVSMVSAVMFSTAERFNRQTTLAMSYNLVLDKIDGIHKSKKNEKYYSAVDAKFIDIPTSSEARMEFAAREALYLTQETNGGSVLETAAGYSQQGIGRVALMYKSYGLQMYYSMLKAGKIAATNAFAKDAEGIELRTMALKQVAGIHGTAIFFAGIQGAPLYGAISMIADLFFLDDEEDDFDTAVRKHMGEGWYKGAVTELTGVDIAGRVRLTGLLLQENRFNKDASLEENLAFYLGGPALSTANRLYRGIEDLRSGDIGSVERGIENLAPAGLTNLYRNTLGRNVREGGIKTRRQDPIYDDMTTGDFAAQALGFPPAEYTFRQEQTARNKGVEKAIVTKRTRLTKQFYIANRMGDVEAMNRLMSEIIEHNNRHPVEAVSPDQIMKSVESHIQTSAKMHNGVTINPLMKYAISMSNREYRQ